MARIVRTALPDGPGPFSFRNAEKGRHRNDRGAPLLAYRPHDSALTIPAADFPDSSFWNKTPDLYLFEPYTQGSPRLVVAFQNAAGQFDGYGALRENTRLNGWELVSDAGQLPERRLGRDGRTLSLPVQRDMVRRTDVLQRRHYAVRLLGR